MKIFQKLTFSVFMLAAVMSTTLLLPSCKSGEETEEVAEEATMEEEAVVEETATEPAALEGDSTDDRGVKVVPPGG
jgi:hypothetical protein